MRSRKMMLQTRHWLAAWAATLLFLPGAAAPAAAGDPSCAAGWSEQRGRVADARSILLSDGRLLRLAGIEPFGILLAGGSTSDSGLTDRLNALLSSGVMRIALVAEKADRYGRLPAMIATDRGELLQERAVREGLAVAFATGSTLPCFDRFLAAENLARQTRRGFWKEAGVVPAHPEALRARIGGMAIFEGVAVSVGNRPYRTYLNFGGRWSEDVTVEIDARDRAAFGGEVELAKLAGRPLRVRGYVQERGGPMLAVRSPLQIETLEAEVAGKVP